MKKHFDIRISGIVQGVFFRVSTKEMADALNIAGTVKNEPDGSVYVEAEGKEENLKAFIQWCQQGPAGASVQKFDLYEGVVKDFVGFRINR